MNKPLYEIEKKETPIIAIALHDGHFIPAEILDHMHLQEHERFREEDPYTAYMIDLPVSKAIVHASRFMVDLNRLEEKAIYKVPEDAWNLQIWKDQFPNSLEQRLMEYYHGFYDKMKELIEETIQKFGYFLILDVHSYNHRRESPDLCAPAVENPEINIGTIYNHKQWSGVIEQFINHLSQSTIAGKHPDVRENIVFKGGGFSQWVNNKYKDKGCVISVEFKKTFMDEWTGRADIKHIQEIREALLSSLPIIEESLRETEALRY